MIKFVTVLLGSALLGCHVDEKKANSKINKSNEQFETLFNSENWCLSKRYGYKGDTSVSKPMKIIIGSDGAFSYLVDGKLIYTDTLMEQNKYGEYLLKHHAFAILRKNDSLNILVYYSNGYDGDEERYKKCK
jgi:hypothetical protein